MKKLPIGVQSFEEMIRNDYLYVDKTATIHELVTEGKYYFLSRPRRFGKTVLVSTLEALFQGKRDLFSGLFIEDKWDWQPSPVIRIDMLGIPSDSSEKLEESLCQRLEHTATTLGITLSGGTSANRLWQLIHALGDREPVVVLIDEYDKPILDQISHPEVATANQKLLAPFYGVLKALHEKIRFVFLTGVSKFTRVSLFSDLNNLEDISISPRFATITGYTDEELDRYFEPYFADGIGDLEGSALREEVRSWYNGYSWDGAHRVYNPVSILLLLKEKSFAAHWFATGTPKFLLEIIRQRKPRLDELASLELSGLSLEGFSPDRVDLVALLFQTGYLTIKSRRNTRHGPLYTMGYPNREVEQSFLTHVLAEFSNDDIGPVELRVRNLGEKLEHGDVEGFCEGLRSIFASIPYNIFVDDREAYYHTVVYLALSLSGVPITGELQTNRGRIDAVLETPYRFYVIEFKLGSAREALDQIQEKDYCAPFRNRGKEVVALGIGLDEEQRNIGDWLTA